MAAPGSPAPGSAHREAPPVTDFRAGAGGGAVARTPLRRYAAASPVLPALALALALSAPAPVPYAPDEVMEFSIEYHGIPTGTARIAVGRPEGNVLPVFLQARTSGLLGVIDVKQHLSSYLDTDTGLPRSASIESVEPGYRSLTTTRFERASSKAIVREKGRYDNTYEIDVPPNAVDFVGLVFKLRTLPLEPGTTHPFDVLAEHTLKQVEAVVETRETLSTKAGKFSAVKVRVPTRFSGKFSEKSPTYVWFSDDERRVVVRISTDFSIGRVDADLTAYSPGKPVEAHAAQQ